MSISCWCAPPLAVGMMTLGLVYFVFLPSIVTTPLAGRAVARFGTRPTFWGALAVAALGLPLLLLPTCRRPRGLGAGRRRHVLRPGGGHRLRRPRRHDRGAASGIYLACYFFGGLVGSAVLGQLFDRFGWAACVAGIGAALAFAALLALRLTLPPTR